MVWCDAILFYFSVYKVFITTGYSGTTDKVSIILVGQGGVQTGIHDLPGPFDRKRQVLWSYIKSQEAHATGAWPGFRSVKQLRVLPPPPPPDGILVHRRVIPSIMSLSPFYTPGWRETMWGYVFCLRKQDGALNRRPFHMKSNALTTTPLPPHAKKHNWSTKFIAYKCCFFVFSVKFFTITDRGVGTVSTVKIRLTQKGVWRDYWLLEQVRRLEFISTDWKK